MNADPGCRTFVEIVADLARRLGLKGVAERVGDQATLDALSIIGYDLAQGSFLAQLIAADFIPTCVLSHPRGQVGSPA